MLCTGTVVESQGGWNIGRILYWSKELNDFIQLFQSHSQWTCAKLQHCEFLSILSMFCKSTIHFFMCPCFFVYDENSIKNMSNDFFYIFWEQRRLGPNTYSQKIATLDISSNLKRIFFWFECKGVYLSKFRNINV